MRNLIVFGPGLHYQKKYHSVLEEQGASIALVVDLQAREEAIRQFFQNQALKPARMIFLQDRHRQDVDAIVGDIVADGVIISTEPKARKAYALWAARRGLPIFMDKPVTAFLGVSERGRLLDDFEAIASVAKEAVVSCERRAHAGYLWVLEYLRNLGLPITGIDIHFAGGVWRLPEEYSTVENHPFKYGYGVLLHSGYHYIDLLVTLLSLNGNNPELSLQYLTSHPMQNYGETDVLLIGQAKKNGVVQTNFSLKLFGTSLSLRKTFLPSEHLEGKIRQEQVIIHVGPYCSVQISSNQLRKIDPASYATEDFNITIMNSPLIERKPIITLHREEISGLPKTASMNTFARQWQLSEFLHRRDGNSPLESHRNTVKLLQAIYLNCLGTSLEFCKTEFMSEVFK